MNIDNLKDIESFELSETDDNWFSEEKEPKPIPPPEKDDKDKKEPVKEEKEEEEQDVDMFTDDSKEEKLEEDVVEDVSNITLIHALKKQGMIDLEEDELEELDETEALRLLQDSYDKNVMETVKGLVQNQIQSPLIREMIVYAANGGNPETFIQHMYKKSGKLSSELDMQKESNQVLVMEELLKLEDYDDEDIESQIEHLKESGRLESISTKKFEKWKKTVEEERKELIEQQQQAIELQKQKERNYRDGLYSFISETEEVGELKISKIDKKLLADYIATRSIDVGNGRIAPFYADLNEVLSNQKASIQLAKLLKERKKDGTFDFSTISREVETKVVRRVKENLERKSTSNMRSGSKKVGEESLIDWLSKNN